jgi:formate dehydrogenase maturation protein FdhE
MTFLAAGKVNYRARIARAELLSLRHPFASEVLSFYGSVASFQKELYDSLPIFWGKQPVAPPKGSLRSEINLPILVKPFAAFLSIIEAQAPRPLAAQAEYLKDQGTTAWAATLETFWKAGLAEWPDGENPDAENAPDPLKEFLARAFLQPYAEFVVAAMLPPTPLMTTCRCPRCNSLPLLGILRQEGDGAKRYLQCSFCSQEWEFRRIFCAKCGEEREDKLPVYVAELFPHVRVESCETCKHFLRTVDLTKDGNAVPLVDDLAALPLSFWAEEQGYQRIQGNLLGT